MSRKKKSSSESKNIVPFPTSDRRSMDRVVAAIHKALAEQDFETIEEANDYIRQKMDMGAFDWDNIALDRNASALEVAQDIFYRALDEMNPAERIRLAKKAIHTCEDCADAWVLLAEEDADSYEEARAYCEKAVAAGESAIGPGDFEAMKGQFWNILETRPYMRAKEALAITCWAGGQKEEAIGHFLEMLDLNPNDNQGIREVLVTCYIQEHRWADAVKIFERYPTGMSGWEYDQALVLFASKGDNHQSAKKLRNAIKANPFIPDYLLGRKKLPRSLPPYYGIGDEREAHCYVNGAFTGWSSVPGAIDWLERIFAQFDRKTLQRLMR